MLRNRLVWSRNEQNVDPQIYVRSASVCVRRRSNPIFAFHGGGGGGGGEKGGGGCGGGVDTGGTSVTLFGVGFDAFTLYPELVSCWFGTDISGITTPTQLSSSEIVCPTPPRRAGRARVAPAARDVLDLQRALVSRIGGRSKEDEDDEDDASESPLSFQ